MDRVDEMVRTEERKSLSVESVELTDFDDQAFVGAILEAHRGCNLVASWDWAEVEVAFVHQKGGEKERRRKGGLSTLRGERRFELNKRSRFSSSLLFLLDPAPLPRTSH